VTEVKLYNSFKKYLPIEFDVIRVENSVSSGMPDVYLRHYSGKHFWLENKIANPNEKIEFEVSQPTFISEHVHNFLGYCLCLIATREVFPEYYLINFNNMTAKAICNLKDSPKTPEELMKINDKAIEKFIHKLEDIKKVIKFINTLCV
jgi:hypothetical protein